MSTSSDEATRSTDTDALLSRYSAHTLGYLSDPFAVHFLPSSIRRSPHLARRAPLINIGTHARTWSVDTLVSHFIAEGGKQVLSVGAGTDTRFWRLSDREREKCTRWVEVDFEQATANKAMTISKKPELRSVLGGDIRIGGLTHLGTLIEADTGAEKGGTALCSPRYSLLPLDIRNLTSLETLATQFDPALPTLLLAECVLIYLDSPSISQLLRWFSSTFREAVVIEYDPFSLHDNFGKVMQRNLAVRSSPYRILFKLSVSGQARGLTLPSAESTPTLGSLATRLTETGFHSPQSLSIRSIRSSYIPADELARSVSPSFVCANKGREGESRVQAIERLDEVEELDLVLEHYAIACASLGQVRLRLLPRGEEAEDVP